MFGQPAGFAGFGQSQPQQAASPFGATPAANPFGAPAFGQQQQQAPAFGAGGGLFGQASAPAFGAASAPAFGAAAPAFGAQQPRPAFGGAFGAAPAFGAAQQPAFGASAPAFGMQQSQPAFGMGAAPAFGMGASTPAFGAATAQAFGAASAPAFGAPNPFGGSTFGASSPAFGAASQPAFGMGAAAPAFGAASAASPFGGGTSIFGATSSASPAPFGTQQPGQQQGLMFGGGGAGGFGMQQQPAVGTRAHAYQKTVEKESSAAGGSGVANYITITAMPPYINKSQEELRFEDYQQGVKSAAAGPPQQQATGGLFGNSAPAFGQAAQAPTFGGGAFGTTQQAPAFGATQQAPAFGSPASAPAFGAASSSAFGFGQSAPAFGATQSTGFFGASSSAFGQTQASGSLFGSSPAFASSPSIFGNSQSAFGNPASSSSMFSFNNAPSIFSNQTAAAPAQPSPFGQPSSSSPFGTSTLSPFSSAAASGGLFSTSTASAFGGGGAFGAKPAFSFASAGAPSPGFPSFSFNSAGQSSPGLFGNTTASAFAPASAPSAGAFNFNSSPGMFNSPAAGFGQMQGAMAAAAPQGPPPSVGQAPYGAFPALPAVSEPKVGISARPVSKGIAGGAGAGGAGLRNSPLLSLRPAGAMPRFGVQVRSTSASPLALIAATPAPTPAAAAADGTPAALSGGVSMSAGAAQSSAGMLLPTRANPHRLFIREPPPATEAAATTSPVLTPMRSPPANDGGRSGAGGASSGMAGTPDRNLNGNYNHHASASNRNGASGSAGVDADGEAVLPRLGRLTAEGYSYEPSAVQLRAMYASDPASLRSVSGFTVIRRGFGQIRWLRPVDVTGLQLHRIVTIGEGEVYCYADEDKPPVGQGLNTDAEVTLYNVYKTDPQTKEHIRSGPMLLKWERQLRSMCAKMDSKFVAYRAEGGVWKFEVEHFSRYGLLDLDDDDEDLEELPVPGEAAARKLPVARFGLVASAEATEDSQGMSDEEREAWLPATTTVADDQQLATYMEDDDARAGSGDQADDEAPGAIVYGLGAAGVGHGHAVEVVPAAGPPLQHSLPVQLNLDPSGLLAMHGSLFGEHAQAGASGVQGLGVEAAAAAPKTSARHMWRRGPSPLTSSAAGTRALLSTEPASPATAAMGNVRQPGIAASVPSTPLPLPAVAGSSQTPGVTATPRVTAPVAAAGAASMCYVDAGLCLGPSFRAGWGPGGTLVYPGNMAGCHAVHVSRVAVESHDIDDSALSTTRPPATHGAPSEAELLRRRLRFALEAHLKFSSSATPSVMGAASGEGDMDVGEAGGEGAAGGGASGSGPDQEPLPRWMLVCDRRTLPRLIDTYLASPDLDLAQLAQQQAGSGSSSAQAAASPDLFLFRRHEAETWRLVQALWEQVEGDEEGGPGSGQEPGGAGEGGESTLGSLDMFASQATLAALRRRRAVGQWLRRQAKVLVEAELAIVSDPAEATLRLAAAGQTAAAAAVAVAAGDVRLATLLAQAGYGARTEAREEMEQQLEVWERSGMLTRMSPDRVLLYRLLAGQVHPVRERLDLDWRRYLGLLLGYAVAPNASPAVAIQQYSASLVTDREVPRPVPVYSDERASLGRCKPHDTYSPSAKDVQYELMCLWAEQQQQQLHGGAQGAGAPTVPSEVLAGLLQAATYTSNPLDASASWHLMTLLQALGALPCTAPGAAAADNGTEDWQAEQEQYSVLLTVQMNLITQLQLAGDMAEWQVYVALHTPEPPSWPGLRLHLVRELLTLNCPEWLSNDSKRHFLTQALGLPQALLAEAESTWARYQGDDARQCAALLASGAAQRAHDLLVSSVAPALFLSGREEQLRLLLSQLESPPAGTAPVPVAEWEAGGGLYLAYLTLMCPADGVPAGVASEGEVGLLLSRLQVAADKLAAASAAAASGGATVGVEGLVRQQQLRQQLAYSRMAHRVHQVVMGTAVGAGEPGSVARKLSAMQSMLGLQDSCLPSELRMSGIATAAAVATAAAAAGAV